MQFNKRSSNIVLFMINVLSVYNDALSCLMLNIRLSYLWILLIYTCSVNVCEPSDAHYYTYYNSREMVCLDTNVISMYVWLHSKICESMLLPMCFMLWMKSSTRYNACTSLPGGRLNIKVLPYHFRDSHYKDKTVLRPSYLYNKNVHTWKDGLYIVTGLSIRFYQDVKSNQNPIPIQHSTTRYIIVSFYSICCARNIKSNHIFGSRLHIVAC